MMLSGATTGTMACTIRSTRRRRSIAICSRMSCCIRSVSERRGTPWGTSGSGMHRGFAARWTSDFRRLPDLASYRDAAKDNQRSSVKVERSKDRLKRVVKRTMQWPGSEPFPMWGYAEGPEGAAPEHYRTDCAIKVMDKLAAGTTPWHLEVHYIEPHDPYFPLKKYYDRYDPKSIPVPRASVMTSKANLGCIAGRQKAGAR